MIYSSMKNKNGQIALALVVSTVVIVSAAFIINYAVNFSKVSKDKSMGDLFKVGSMSIMNYVELSLKKRWVINDQWMKGGNNDLIANVVTTKGRVEKEIPYNILSNLHPIKTVMSEMHKYKIDSVNIIVTSLKSDIKKCFEVVKAPVMNPALLSVTLRRKGDDVYTATSCISFRNIPLATYAAILYGGLDLNSKTPNAANSRVTSIKPRAYDSTKFNPNAQLNGKFLYYKTQFLSPIRVHGDIILPELQEIQNGKELINFAPVLFSAPITVTKTAPTAKDGVIYRGKNRYSPKFVDTSRAFYSEKAGLTGIKAGISYNKFDDPGLYCIYNPNGGDCKDNSKPINYDRNYCNDTNTLMTNKDYPLGFNAPYRLARNRSYDKLTKISKADEHTKENDIFFVRSALLGYDADTPMKWTQMGKRNWFFKEVSSFKEFNVVVNNFLKKKMRFPSNVQDIKQIRAQLAQFYSYENTEQIYFDDKCNKEAKKKCVRSLKIAVTYAPYKNGRAPGNPENFNTYDHTINLSEFLIVVSGKAFNFHEHDLINELGKHKIKFEGLTDVSGRDIFNRDVNLRSLLHMTDRINGYPLEFINKYNGACVNNNFSVDINKSYRYAHSSWDITYDPSVPVNSGKRDLMITSNSGGGIKVVDPANINKMDGAKETLLKYNEDMEAKPDSLYTEGNILIRTVARKCIITSNVTFVAGLLFCKEGLIIKSRFQDLDIVGTVITKKIKFEDEKPKYRTRFMSLLSPEGIILLKKRGILLNSQNMGKCQVPWHKDAPTECLTKMFRTNPTYLARKAEPFMWPKVTPNCILGPDGVICKRLKNFDIEEFDKKYFFGSP